MGFSKGPDGVFVSPTEGRFTPENRVSSGANQQREAAILAASLRQAGIELQTFTFGASLLLDGQFRVTYPTLDSSGAGGDESNIVHSLSAALIPKPENRWTGQNRGAWSHPEYERLVQAYDTTLDRTERNQQVAEAMGLVSRELPWIPFYFNLRVVAHVKELSGLQLGAINSTPFSNVHEWEFQ